MAPARPSGAGRQWRKRRSARSTDAGFRRIPTTIRHQRVPDSALCGAAAGTCFSGICSHPGNRHAQTQPALHVVLERRRDVAGRRPVHCKTKSRTFGGDLPAVLVAQLAQARQGIGPAMVEGPAGLGLAEPVMEIRMGQDAPRLRPVPGVPGGDVGHTGQDRSPSHGCRSTRTARPPVSPAASQRPSGEKARASIAAPFGRSTGT